MTLQRYTSKTNVVCPFELLRSERDAWYEDQRTWRRCRRSRRRTRSPSGRTWRAPRRARSPPCSRVAFRRAAAPRCWAAPARALTGNKSKQCFLKFNTYALEFPMISYAVWQVELTVAILVDDALGTDVSIQHRVELSVVLI